LPNQAELAEQVKAWAWVGHELRQQGARVTLPEREAEAEQNVEVATVVVLPADGQDAPAYEEARAAFDEIGVEQLTPEQTDELGARAAERLRELTV